MSAARKRHLWSLPQLAGPARRVTDLTADSAADGAADGAADNSADDGHTARQARLTELHQACFADLLRFVQRRLSGPEAEDVVATVFETAWVRLDDMPHGIQDARPWLFGVARNVMANHHRAAVRRTGLAVRLATTTTPDADVQLGEHEGFGARIDLVRAWRTLGEGDQEVLSLVAFDGLPGDQAAQVLKISRSAFAMRLQRARQRLALALDSDTNADSHPGASATTASASTRDGRTSDLSHTAVDAASPLRSGLGGDSAAGSASDPKSSTHHRPWSPPSATSSFPTSSGPSLEMTWPRL